LFDIFTLTMLLVLISAEGLVEVVGCLKLWMTASVNI